MGFYAASDCELGLTLNHGGGYPGYGSHVLLLPDYGVGIFALANRTYAGPRPPVWDAAVTLLRAGRLKPRSLPPSSALTTAYAATTRMFAAGAVTSAGDVFAMNFLMDRDAEHWARDLAALKAQVGTCDTNAPIVADRRAVRRLHLALRERSRQGTGAAGANAGDRAFSR